MAYPEAVGRIGEVGQRDPGDPGDLLRISDAHVPRVVPPADHGDDQVVRGPEEELLESGEDADAGRVDAGLLLRLPQRRPDRVVVTGVGLPTGERRLPGVAAQVRGLLDE